MTTMTVCGTCGKQVDNFNDHECDKERLWVKGLFNHLNARIVKLEKKLEEKDESQ